jgi:large subunit ribosomal protein L39e
MGSNKEKETKEMLASAAKSDKRVPLWVMMKTNRKVSSNPGRKHWRSHDKGKELKRKKQISKKPRKRGR